MPPSLLSVIMELTLAWKIREGIFMRKVSLCELRPALRLRQRRLLSQVRQLQSPAGPRRGPPGVRPPARVSAASKDRPRPAAQPKTPPVGPRTVSYGGPQGGTPWEEPPARRQRSPLKLLVLVLVSLFLLCIVLPFVLGLMLNLSEAFAGRRPEPGRLPRRSPPAGLTPFGSPFPFTVPSR